jgi:hypothetical protein
MEGQSPRKNMFFPSFIKKGKKRKYVEGRRDWRLNLLIFEEIGGAGGGGEVIMMMTMTTIHFSTLSTAKSYICCINKHVLVIPDTTHSIFSES